MKILVACEESQRVASAFRAKGHEAYSCDIQPCSGKHPEYHICGDVLKLLQAPCYFHTCDYKLHHVAKWNMLIAFPPCTFLSFAGNRAFNVDRYGEKAIARYKSRCKAAAFFMQFANAPGIEKICIENPLGIMSVWYRNPDQIIHPYFFAESDEEFVKKRTCLWLTNLQPLEYTEPKKEPGALWVETRPHHTDKDRQKERSKTFFCIANAMAEQWG